MASPPAGVDPNKWAAGYTADLRRRGINPVSVGFNGTQQEQDDWGRASQSQQQAKPAGNFSAYSPGQARSQQNPYATSTPYGQQGGQQQTPSGGYQAYPPQQGGYQQYGQPAPKMNHGPRQTGFQFTGGTDWMGNQYTDPNAMMAQQGAMAQALNQQRQGMLGQGQFGSLNPQMAYNQGMGMLQQGWQNPFNDYATPDQQSPWPSRGEFPARRDNAAEPRRPAPQTPGQAGQREPPRERNDRHLMPQVNGTLIRPRPPGQAGPNGEPPGSGHWGPSAPYLRDYALHWDQPPPSRDGQGYSPTQDVFADIAARDQLTGIDRPVQYDIFKPPPTKPGPRPAPHWLSPPPTKPGPWRHPGPRPPPTKPGPWRHPGPRPPPTTPPAEEDTGPRPPPPPRADARADYMARREQLYASPFGDTEEGRARARDLSERGLTPTQMLSVARQEEQARVRQDELARLEQQYGGKLPKHLQQAAERARRANEYPGRLLDGLLRRASEHRLMTGMSTPIRSS